MHPIHPMVVHFPIALWLTSLLFDLLAYRWNSRQFRTTSLLVLAVGVAAGLVTVITGHFAEEAAERSGIPKAAIELHEELAFPAFLVFVGLLGLRTAMAWEWITERPVLVTVIGVAGAALLLTAGYFGGDLVYRYGAGVMPR